MVVVYTVCPKTLLAAVSEVAGGVAREKGRVWGHVAAVATQWAPRSICTYIILYVVLLVCARHKKGLCGAWSPSVVAAAAAKYNQTNVQCYYIVYRYLRILVYTSIKHVLFRTCLNGIFGLQRYIVYLFIIHVSILYY